jgi:transketolase
MYLIDNIFEPEMKTVRDGFGEGLVLAGKKNKNVVALTADVSESVRANLFAEEFPDRFVEMGIAEQNMMGVAAGMSLVGKIPFACSYAVFNPGRNWDQLRVSVCYTNANVKILGSHAGIDAGADGATHQALEDIAITRVLPNMTILVPADAVQAVKATLMAVSIEGPVYIRLSRSKSPVFFREESPFEVGKAQILRQGVDLTIVACGSLVYEALMVAEEMRGEVDIEIINMHTIKPIDKDVVLSSVCKTKRVITIEDHQIIGGLGGAVAEILAEGMNERFKMKRMGMKNEFGQSGESSELLSFYGLNRSGIENAVKKMMS